MAIQRNIIIVFITLQLGELQSLCSIITYMGYMLAKNTISIVSHAYGVCLFAYPLNQPNTSLQDFHTKIYTS